MPQHDINRRAFLESTAASGLAAAALTGSARAAVVAQNEAIRVGIVGPGGRGIGLLKDCIEHGRSYNARLTAVCDIWNMRRERAAATVKDAYGEEPKVYRNYEQLLADDDIDALIIATADHQHAKMLKMAIEAGKDVYCEKTLGNVLSETNDAFKAVMESDRIVQLGTQRRSDPKYRAAMEAMQQGKVGEIAKIDVIWNKYSPYRWARTKDDLNSVKKSDIDWQAFLLGKPDRPYDPRIFRSFRLFKEFSSGIIDQWMSHGIDVVHMLSGELYPRSVMAQGGIYHWRDYRENPDTVNVSLEYGEGEKRFLATYATCFVNGAEFSTRVFGTHGTLDAEEEWRISGDGSKRPDAIKQSEPIEPAKGTLHHMANWLDAVRTRDASSLYANAEAGYGHSIACILATDSLWSGRRMVFNPATQEIVAG